jgi:hypothetical protein
MTDLERLFRRLVANVAAADPARLHRPMRVDDILETHLPYRSNRRALEVDSSEDYELLVLRLVAGEAGLAQPRDPAAAQAFRAELASSNPDLDVLRRHAEAELALAGDALAFALGPGPEERAYGPPEAFAPRAAGPDDEPEPPVAEEATGEIDDDDPAPIPAPARPAWPSVAAATPPITDELLLDAIRFSRESQPAVPVPPAREPHGHAEGESCAYCGGTLPTGRTVRFCPHCGQSQTGARCPACDEEVELGWRHCVACGHRLRSPG